MYIHIKTPDVMYNSAKSTVYSVNLRPSINTARHGACVAAFAGYLYVMGGEVAGVALRDVQRFCPRGTQKWERVALTCPFWPFSQAV